MKKNAKKGLRKGRGSRNTLKIEDIEAVFAERKPGAEGNFKFFSVLVPLVAKEDDLYLLYEVRAKNMERQPGEICFPGGELEPVETTEECALRETWEEIGIPQEQIRVITQLDTLYTYSNFAMYCYLGVIPEAALEHLQFSENEVDEVFLVALNDLLAVTPEVYPIRAVPQIPEDFPYDKVYEGKPYPWRGGKGSVPIYEVDGRVIWGLTARITKHFLEIITEKENTDV